MTLARRLAGLEQAMRAMALSVARRPDFPAGATPAEQAMVLRAVRVVLARTGLAGTPLHYGQWDAVLGQAGPEDRALLLALLKIERHRRCGDARETR